MTMEIMYLVPENMATPNNFIIDGAFRQPCLWVNAKGERFMNEDAIANTTFAGNAIAAQPGKFAYSIFDSALLKKYKKKGSDIQSHVHPLDMFDHFEEAVEGALAAGYKHVFAADSIEELAEQMGIDPDVLAADRRRVQRPLRRGVRRALREGPPVPAAHLQAQVLRLPVLPERVRHPGRHQDQLQGGSARREPRSDPRPVRGRPGRLHHLRRQLPVHPAGQHHGLRAELGPDRGRERGGSSGWL